MSKPYPLIAILSDFGDQDWYVASMKAVIAGVCPEARTIDISHQVEPGNIRAGAFILSQCYRDFPRGTVFLCVVDPGVGSSRKPIVHYDGDYYFIGPDNGLFALLEPGMCRVYEIEPHRMRHTGHRLSNTFHGRDIFAPAAALLAEGSNPAEFASPLPRIAHDGIEFPEVNRVPTEGTIIYFDHYGNAITNLRLGKISPLPEKIRLSEGTVIPFANAFSDVPEGQPVAYAGSGGFIELAINRGSARVSLNLEAEPKFQLV